MPVIHGKLHPYIFCDVLLGLSVGDSPGSQPIGIVLTVVGVVVLDFCADASEGPIRAYLLDVADTEEQDVALNIHAFSAGNSMDSNSLKNVYIYICDSITLEGAAFILNCAVIDVCLFLFRARRGSGLHAGRSRLDWNCSGPSI